VKRKRIRKIFFPILFLFSCTLTPEPLHKDFVKKLLLLLGAGDTALGVIQVSDRFPLLVIV
jgi:hypothetical protein